MTLRLHGTRRTARLGGRFAAEVRCWYALAIENSAAALSAAEAWQQDEPYSGRPSTVGSFIALSLTNDPVYAAQIAREGLLADPKDQLLRNNYVVALARTEKFPQAVKEFTRIREPFQAGYPQVTSRAATAGLLAFGLGELDLGRRLYGLAMKQSDPVNRWIVLANWIQTETRFCPGQAKRMSDEARLRVKDIKNPIADAVMQNTLCIVDAAQKFEDSASQGSKVRAFAGPPSHVNLDSLLSGRSGGFTPTF